MKIKNFLKALINFINDKPFAVLVILILILTASVLVVQAALTLNASSVTSDGALSLTAGGTNQNIILTPSGIGNVGIGTTTPQYKLDINGDLRIFTSSTLGNVISGIWNGTAIGDAYISSAINWNGKQPYYWVNSGSYLYPTSTSWNIGVGTTTPAFSLVINGTSTFGNNSGYLQIENDGTLQLSGNSTTFEDLKFPANALAAGATPADPCVVVGGLRVRCFDGGSTTESMEMIIQMPHNWKLGSTIYPHVHWGPSDTGAGNVKWQFEYSWQNTNGAFTTSTIISLTAATDGVAHKNFISSFPSITSSTASLSSIILGRIFRVPTGDDTYTSDAELYEFDIHYEIDSLGSRQETEK